MNAIQLIEERFQVTLPDDLKAFWLEPYKDTFTLYHWWYQYKLFDPFTIADEAIDLPGKQTGRDVLDYLKREGRISEEEYTERCKNGEFDLVLNTHDLNQSYHHVQRYHPYIYTLIPIAKDIHPKEFFLACGYNKEGQYCGLYYWALNHDFEFPVFIANSVTDLINDGILQIAGQPQESFNTKKHLGEILEMPATGYITTLQYRTWLDKGEQVIMDQYKTLFDFYRTSFQDLRKQTIDFELKDDLFIVTIKKSSYGYPQKLLFNVVEENLIDAIEKLNTALNTGDDLQSFGRPRSSGYYIIDEDHDGLKKHLAYIPYHLFYDLVRKGYIMPRLKVFPMNIYYRQEQSDLDRFKRWAEKDGNNLKWVLPQ